MWDRLERAATVAEQMGATVRDSGAVESMNRVLRVERGRHRRMTQPMLERKRL